MIDVMTISIPKNLEARLHEQAKRSGMDTNTYVTELLARAVAPTLSANSIAELFDQLRKEQWTDDPAEISRRAHEEAEFMEAMNRNRVEMDGPDARKIYP
jgi:hypothetical protein